MSINDYIAGSVPGAGSVNDKLKAFFKAVAEGDPSMRTGAIRESFNRKDISGHGTVTVNNTLHLSGINLWEGDVVSQIVYLSGATAAVTPTHQWVALYTGARAKLGVSADLTNTAWAGDAEQTFTLTSPITITESGLYLIGIVIVAGTHPTLAVQTGRASANAAAPAVAGASTAALTDPADAPATAGAMTGSTNRPWTYVK